MPTTDTGTFQLNDVVLSIPPEQIRVEHKPMNRQMFTLRTGGAHKLKSNQSLLTISVSAKFTDKDNGFVKLRDIISQFRVTPFCYVENQYLRNTVLSGDSNQSMALALQSMTISTDPNSTNCLDVMFNFYWFHYFPYIKDFVFKKDIFSPIAVKDPKNSLPWKILYRAEQKRKAGRWNDTVYRQIHNIASASKASSTTLSYPQFAMMQVKKYQQLQQDVSALRSLRDKLSELENDATDRRAENASTMVYQTLAEALQDPERAKVLKEEILGATTSFGDDEQDFVSDLTDTLDNNLSTNTKSKYQVVVNSEWKVLILGDGEGVASKKKLDLTEETLKKFETEDDVLLVKDNTLNFGAAGIIPTKITISLQNMLAPLQLVGHPYPTFQYTGNTDVSVLIEAATTTEAANRALSNFNNVYESQNLKNRSIPQGQRNVTVSNDIVNMCGLREFMIDGLSFSTIPSTTDTSSIVLRLTENPVNSQTKEAITPTLGFLTDNDVRLKIAEIIEDNLSIVENVATLERSGDQFQRFVARDFRTKIERREVMGSFISKEMDVEVPIENGYYQYTGDTDNRHQGFKNICQEYGRRLGALYAKMLPILSDVEMQQQNPERVKEIIDDIYSKEDIEFFSIRFIVNDLRRYIYIDTNNIKRKKSGRASLVGWTGADQAAVTVNLVYKHLEEWQKWAIDFIDNIISSGLTALPEFSAVKAMQEASILQAPSSSTAYPDFPLEEVIGILQMSNNKGLNLAFDKIKELGFQKQLYNKNLSLATMIGPDFYFYNDQKDSIFRLVDSSVIGAAINSIKTSQGTLKSNAEEKWFADEYNTKHLGQLKSKHLKQLLQKTALTKDALPTYWRSSGADDKNALAKESVAAAVQSSLRAAQELYPDDLQGEVKGSVAASKGMNKDISVSAFNAGRDGFNVIAARRPETTLKAAEHADIVRHRFGLEVLDTLGETFYVESTDGGTLVTFSWPTDSDTRRVTSEFGPRNPPQDPRTGELGSSDHRGLDICSQRAGQSAGRRCLAAADGEIFDVVSRHQADKGNACWIKMRHGGGYVTYYTHLQYDSMMRNLIEVFHGKKFSTDERRVLLKKNRGDHIANIGNSGRSSGPHLHFEVRKGGVRIDPRIVLSGSHLPSMGPIAGLDPRNESLLTKSVEQFEKDMQNGQGYSMARAYPTFRLHFIESDLGERKVFGTDDFFSYNSVSDIEIIDSRKIPVSLAVIRMTNISGIFGRRIMKARKEDDYIKRDKDDIPAENAAALSKTNTKEENPISRMVLKPGTNVELRLGYNNNPDELEIPFVGFITDIQFVGESDELVEITCQSYQAELVQNIHGNAKTFGGFLSSSGRTSAILEELIAMPDAVHFGRWEPGVKLNRFRGLVSSRWQLRGNPADDNIFAPTGTSILGLWDTTPKYHMYNATIWDVIQEMTLRHPAYIAQAVPYKSKYGTRMTLFFGLPDQLYTAKDPTDKDDRTVDELDRFIKEAANNFSKDELLQDTLINAYSTVESEDVRKALAKAEDRDEAVEYWVANTIKNFALDNGFVKPFRSYHTLTSTLHILENNIRSSSYNTFNACTVQYSDDNPDVNEETGRVDFGDLETFTLLADAAIPDEDKREMLAQFPNCVGYEMAKRYALSLLWGSLQDTYQGTLKIIGNPRIKPNDVCYVLDEYTDMYGPVGVEQVVHRVNAQEGFVTEIVPDMTVHVNQASTLATSDAMGLIVEHSLNKLGLQSLPSIIENCGNGVFAGGLVAAAAGTGAAALAGGAIAGGVILNRGFGIISRFFGSGVNTAIGAKGPATLLEAAGAFIFRKLITRSQMAHPFRYSPLVYRGKPMIGGLPNNKTDGSFWQGIGTWIKETVEVDTKMYSENLYDRFFNINNWVDYQRGEINKH